MGVDEGICEIQAICGNCIHYHNDDFLCDITASPVVLRQECMIDRFEPKRNTLPHIKETVSKESYVIKEKE